MTTLRTLPGLVLALSDLAHITLRPKRTDALAFCISLGFCWAVLLVIIATEGK